MRPVLLLASILLPGLAVPVQAQTLFGVEFSDTAPPVVKPFVRPAEPTNCNYPNPTPLPSFDATAEDPCWSLPTGGPEGDIAVDRGLYVAPRLVGFGFGIFVFDQTGAVFGKAANVFGTAGLDITRRNSRNNIHGRRNIQNSILEYILIK